jgi:hypothetical protein
VRVALFALSMARSSIPLGLALAFPLLGCKAHDAPRTPEETCVLACGERVSKCDESGCRRGCNFSLDRLIERETSSILACVASTKNGGCDDRTWAECDARVGAHADGGPPPPPPAPED